VEHCGAGNRGQLQGGCSVLARATKRVRICWDRPFCVRNKIKKNSLDGDPEGEQSGG